MPHMVESMMYVREKPWHGLGNRVEHALDSEQALVAAGLAWAVEKEPIYVGGKEVEGHMATVRQTDRMVLGIVGDRYKVVNNAEAFRFTDELLGEGVRYETAGSLRGGRTVWLLAKMPEPFKVAGDDVEPYLVFSNSHDGTSAVKVALTPIRVVCANTAWSLQGAQRTWSMHHTSSVHDRMAEARQTLALADLFMNKLAREADVLAEAKVAVDELLAHLFPIQEDTGDVAKRNAEEARKTVYEMTKAADIRQFEGTAWGFLNAVSDYVTHRTPSRQSDTFKERRFEKLVNGDQFVGKGSPVSQSAGEIDDQIKLDYRPNKVVAEAGGDSSLNLFRHRPIRGGNYEILVNYETYSNKWGAKI